jgi:ribosome recycling factor
MADVDLSDIDRRMDGALSALQKEFNGLRTGRASPNLLEPVVVDAYGSKMPLNQVAAINVPDARLLTVQVWDSGLVNAVEKSIRQANLGLNPQIDGTLIRLPIPDLNEERRSELSKLAAKYAEQARVAVRNVRRDGMDRLKELEKENEISEDEHHAHSADIQSSTDDHIAKIDAALATKEHDIMQV